MKKRMLQILLLLFLLYISFSSREINNHQETNTIHDSAFLSTSVPILSPSGIFEAIMTETNTNGIRSIIVEIHPIADKKNNFALDIELRKRDMNFVLWADQNDVLWVYSGDIGVFYWVYQNGHWIKNTYVKNKTTEVPTILRAIRPRSFE